LIQPFKTSTMRFTFLSLVLFLPFFSFSQCEQGQYPLTLTTTTGDYAYEIGWTLYSYEDWTLQNNNSIADFSGNQNYQTTSQEVCLPSAGCYIIHATDEYDDGWEEGTLEIEGFNLSENYEMEDGSNIYWTFEMEAQACDWEIPGCTNQNAVNYDELATIDNGSCIDFINFDHNKTNRRYLFHLPTNLSPDAPLVFVFHGYSGDPLDIMNYSKMNDVADENGFAVCYPEGSMDQNDNLYFNVGYDMHSNSTVDDVDFAISLAQYLQETHNLSTTNTFSTGMSNGGDLSYMLACQASDVFRAIAPVAGMILLDIYNDCDGANPVPVFEIHGTQDNVTPFEGDINNQEGWGAFLDIPSTIDYFVDKNNLTDLEVDTLPNIDTEDNSFVISYQYSSDNSSDQVWLYKVIGGGHDWPGAYGNMDLNSSQKIWEFFNLMQSSETTSIAQSKTSTSKKLVKICNLLGQQTKTEYNTPLFYMYSDGSVEKKIILEK
jgi:polyhydroxybutyrate depolymerase